MITIRRSSHASLSPSGKIATALVLLLTTWGVADEPAESQEAAFEIRGACLDSDREPIEGVRVRLFLAERRSDAARQIEETVSNADGKFQFSNLRPPVNNQQEGKYRIYGVAATDVGRTTKIAQFTSAESRRKEFILRKPGTLKGRVTNSAGQPLADAVVYFLGINGHSVPDAWSATTNEEGYYALTDIFGFTAELFSHSDPNTGLVKLEPRSRIFFRVSHPDYGMRLFSPTIIPGTFDIVMEDPAIVEGIVFDAVHNKPAANVAVHAAETDPSPNNGVGSAITDVKGRFDLRLIPGVYNIYASQPGRTTAALESFVAVAGANNPADLRLITGGFIEGRLLDNNGNPVGGTAERPIRIGLHGPSRPRSGGAIESVLVNEDGTYRIRVAPGENYPYVSSAGIPADRNPRTVSKLPPVVVQEGETVTVDIHVGGVPQAD